MMLLDAQVHELFDALSRYRVSPRGAEDQFDVLAAVTMADAALRTLWGGEQIHRQAAAIDGVLESALRTRMREIGTGSREGR
jgi:hypothetical protein